MPKSTLRFISAEKAAKALSMKEAIELMKSAFSELSSGELSIPQRVNIDISQNNGAVLFMPAYSPKNNSLGIKIASIFNDNPLKGLPTIHALIIMFDAESGKPLAIMDGEHLTALRTGAASGLATDLLARKNAKTVAIFGTGIQGRTQLEAVSKVRELDRCFLFDKNRKNAEKFERDMSAKLDIEFLHPKSAKDLANADIVCTSTNSYVPVFEDIHIKRGTHINAIGAYTPEMSEIPPETLGRSKIIVDQRSACFAEAGDILKSIDAGTITSDDLYAELGEIIDKKKTGRIADSEITLFKSVGNAIQDLVCANKILQNVIEKNIGTEVDM